MPSVKLQGADEVVQRFDRLGDDVQAALLATSRILAASLQARVASSMASSVEVGDGAVTAEVFSSGAPVSAETLSFIPGSRRVFAQVAHLPDVTAAERSSLRTALQDMADEITSELQQAVVRALKGPSS